ncbi:MAG: right-handed parallel beta-helix repeat-containing protein [Oscillospiraceae bacterium]|nr:right-handed parallel beta-helix repeat-containing protein [Oscillospiraceae bacterium]
MKKILSIVLTTVLLIPVALLSISSEPPENISTNTFPQSSSALPPRGHTGLAANYTGDVGIGNDPDVILAEDFAACNTASDLRPIWATTNESHLSINTNPVNAVTGTKSLQLHLPAQNIERHTGISLELDETQQQDAVFVRYYQKFDEHYAVPVGVSNHNGTAVSSKYWTSGPEHMGPGKAANGTNKFLVEFESAASSAMGDYTMHAYVYHPEQRYNYEGFVPIPGMPAKDPGEPWTPEYTHKPGEQYADIFFPDGEVQPWNYWRGNYGDEFIPRPKFFIELDRWYCYELMIQTNTPGKRDGRITAWIDGEVTMDIPNMRFRDVADLKIDLVGFSFGSASNPAATNSWFDNIVIAKSYIGPVYDGITIEPNPIEQDGAKVRLTAIDARSDRNNPVFKSAPVTITGNGTYTATVHTVGYQDFAGLALMSEGANFDYFGGSNIGNATPSPTDWEDAEIIFNNIKINEISVGNNLGITPLFKEGYVNAQLWNGWEPASRQLTGVTIVDTGTNHGSACFTIDGITVINKLEVEFTVTGIPDTTQPPQSSLILDVVQDKGNDLIKVTNITDKAFYLRGFYITDDDGELFKWKIPSLIVRAGEFVLIKTVDGLSDVLKRAEVTFDVSLTEELWLSAANEEVVAYWNREYDDDLETIHGDCEIMTDAGPGTAPNQGRKGILRTVNVSTQEQLSAALTSAKPGDEIVLESGVYLRSQTGRRGSRFYANIAGTQENPIYLRSADPENPSVLDGVNAGSGYVLYLEESEYWVIEDIEVRNAQKGIVLDKSNHSIIRGCYVYNTGEEAIAIRDDSSYCLIEYTKVTNTGLTGIYSEGIYIGSSYSNWGSYGAACDYNTVSHCVLGPDIRAKAYTDKEGTTGNVVQCTTFFGKGMENVNSSRSFMELQGNESIVRYNTFYRQGNDNITAGIKIYGQVSGWGERHDIHDNTFYLDFYSGTSTGGVFMIEVVNYQGSCRVSNNTTDPAECAEYYRPRDITTRYPDRIVAY